jgi:hypothetical protein
MLAPNPAHVYLLRNARGTKFFTKRRVLRWCEAYSLEMIKTINKKNDMDANEWSNCDFDQMMILKSPLIVWLIKLWFWSNNDFKNQMDT